MVDLDQGGLTYQKTRVYLGPSLGWVEVQVMPSQAITAVGSYTLVAGASMVMVNVAGLVTINLPDVSKWLLEVAYQPATGFERAIWVKDLGGNAAAFNITIHPFGTQKIDNLQQDFTIVQNRQLIRLYPMNDLSGWFVG
jgi:hypothetical protein